MHKIISGIWHVIARVETNHLKIGELMYALKIMQSNKEYIIVVNPFNYSYMYYAKRKATEQLNYRFKKPMIHKLAEEFVKNFNENNSNCATGLKIKIVL